MSSGKSKSRYDAIIVRIFKAKYRKGKVEIHFGRHELESAASELGIKLPKNLGDVIYSFRYRKSLPDEITRTAPDGLEWIIEGAGSAKYKFCLTKLARIRPNEHLAVIKIPDATPEIISLYALNDEQALLAKLRYNRLVDVFLGLVAYPLQSHMRTQVKGIGQIEIDEIYVGVSKTGEQFVIPVQAKGGSDQLGFTQAKQDIMCCREKFPHLSCRSVCAQFINNGETIVMFEIVEQGEELKVLDEKHYRLIQEPR